MRKAPFPAAALACVLLAGACAKEIGKVTLLTDDATKTWTLVERFNNGSPEFLNDCELSWRLEVAGGGTYSADFTDPECGSAAEQGTWSFNAQETRITFDDQLGGDVLTWDIVQLTADSLRLKNDETGFGRETLYLAE